MNPEARILIVDDEEAVLNALERTLKPEGVQVVRTTSPQEALRILREEPVDIVVSDHLMPGMKGLDLLREARQAAPDTLRILLTGFADLQLALAAINQGEVYRFFQKPWDEALLRMDIRIALMQRKLERENAQLRDTVRTQAAFLQDLERKFPGISEVKRTASGAIVIDDEDL